MTSCFPSLEQSTRNPVLSPRYSHQWKCHISQQAAEVVLVSTTVDSMKRTAQFVPDPFRGLFLLIILVAWINAMYWI